MEHTAPRRQTKSFLNSKYPPQTNIVTTTVAKPKMGQDKFVDQTGNRRQIRTTAH